MKAPSRPSSLCIRSKSLVFLAWVMALGTTQALDAQGRTWIVDAQNRPGTHFLALSQINASVKDGDTVLVRRGDYGEFTLDKAIALLCETGTRIVTQAFWGKTQLKGIGTGRTLRIRNLEFVTSLTSGTDAVQLLDSKGIIVLDECRIVGSGQATGQLLPPEALLIRNCAAVTLDRSSCTLGTQVDQSRVVFSDCSLSGLNAAHIPTFPTPLWNDAAEGLLMRDSTVHLSQCRTQGGNGDIVRGGALLAARPGIRMIRSGLVLTGDGTSLVVAGKPPSTQTGNLPAILGDASSQVLRDPAPILTPTLGSRKILGVGSEWARPLPFLTAMHSETTSITTVRTRGMTGEWSLLLLALPGLPTAIGDPGQLWLDPRQLWVMDVARLATPPIRTVPIPIPNNSALRGLGIAFQSLVGSTLGTMGLSSPTAIVLN